MADEPVGRATYPGPVNGAARRAAVAAVLVLLASGLAVCGDDDSDAGPQEPRPTPTPTATQASETTPAAIHMNAIAYRNTGNTLRRALIRGSSVATASAMTSLD